MKERQAVTKALCERYRKAPKKQKGMILDEFIELTGYNRCYARRLLRNHGRRVRVTPTRVVQGDARLRQRTPRKKKYGPEILAPLKKLWAMLDYICAKRLQPALPGLLERLDACGELRLKKAVREKLLAMSAATMDRLLAPERKKFALKSKSRTKPGTLLKHQIPIRTFAEWDDARPGFLEMDLVGHDGGSTHGDYCQTLDVTDVNSGWTELAAVRNKAQIHVFAAIQALRERLPFEMLGLDSDNGGEFINDQLARYCEQEQISLTRTRPGRKNDNCFVEQKNWSVVRRFSGYARFESTEACATLNELYTLLRDYNNFFLPSVKLQEKTRDGAHVKRRYDTAKTPFQRLLDSPHISKKIKKDLRAHFETLNPAALRRRITALQKRLDNHAVRPRNQGGAV